MSRVVVLCIVLVMAALFFTATATPTHNTTTAAPVLSDDQVQLANGPTIPPGPWDDKPWPVDQC